MTEESGHLVSMMPVPTPPSLGATPVPQQRQVEGEVRQAFPSVIVISNEQRQALVQQHTPRTQLSGPLNPIDKIGPLYSPWNIVCTAENRHGAHAVGVIRNL